MANLWTGFLLRRQLAAARRSGLAALLIAAAEARSLPPAYVLAVASRETGIRNIRGDGGHGHGVMQIDDRYHGGFLRECPDWQTRPGRLIEYGVRLLAANVSWARVSWPPSAYPWAGEAAYLKIAASAYNAGPGGARRGVLEADSDRYTTGRNYGRDVLRRMEIFAGLLKETNR